MGRLILISVLLAIMAVFVVAHKYEPKQRTIVKITDVKAGIEREKLKNYLYQGFWKNKLVWRPKWVREWQEKTVSVPIWKSIWQPVEVTEWVTMHAPPPSWVKNVDEDFVVKLPE